MKITSLFAVASVVLAGATAVMLNSGEEKTAPYSPRTDKPAGSFLEAVEYLKLLRGNIETGEFETGDYTSMAQAVNQFDRNHAGERDIDLSWWEVGPNNIGGRTRAILAVTNDLIFAGSVSGGLYKSTNGGNNWTRVESLDTFGKTMAISCIEQTGDGTIYLGTGSRFETGFDGSGSSSTLGVGLFRSTDMGATWSLIPETEPDIFSNDEDWSFINKLSADPRIPTRVWIAGEAGIGYFDSSNNELNMDMDGIPNLGGHDVEWAPDGSYVLAGMSNGRVYRSPNGTSFTQIGGGFLNQKQRVDVAISPDNVNVIYALTAESGFMGGLFYSTDAGNSWNEKWPSGVDATYSLFGDNGQAFYDLALIVKPGDPGTCWLGGVTLWKSGSANQPEQIAYNFDFGNSEYYVHSDIHTFEIAPNGDWYIGCDGGIFKSVDGGVTFRAMNRGYVTTQFYNIGHGGGYPVIGGTQDNGTILVPGMDLDAFEVDSWQQGVQVSGGDGFACDLSNVTVPGVNVAFTSVYNGALGRYTANGSGGAYYDSDILQAIGSDGEAGPFYTMARLYENTADEGSEQFVLLVNNRKEDLYSYIDDEGNTVWLDTTLFTQNLTLPFNYRFPLGDTLHYFEELIRPEIWTTEPLTEDPNYPWLAPQALTSQVDSCITDSVLVGTETVIDQIIEETIWVYWEDSVFVPELNDYFVYEDSAEVVIDTDTTYIEVPVYEYTEICTTWYYYASDLLENVRESWKIQDKYTSMMVTGFFGNEGMWITRQALNFNVTPDWWKFGNAPASGVHAFEFTEDGTTLFYSSWAGQLFRVKNLDQLWSAADVGNLQIDQIIAGAGGPITSIASDPNDKNHLVITIGGYGSVTGGKVRETNNAMAANPNFSNIWDFSGEETVLERMPVFASVIDVSDESGNTIVVGTDFGVWASNDGGDNWNHTGGVSDGIPGYPEAGGSQGTLKHVPVFDLRQQQVGLKPYMTPNNYGTIFAGTHGRGMWRSDDFFSVGVQEEVQEVAAGGQLLIFPNPTEGEAFASIELNAPVTNMSVRIFSINGQLVREFRTGQLSGGSHRISLQSEDLSKGSYVVHLSAGDFNTVGKFIRR